ncbi:hypothetical protein BDR07DRAFT_1353739 [Suillus spraguei]|nr:hypothetical protein BDR07DRAFT_1353739 [Suillus spraguei]
MQALEGTTADSKVNFSSVSDIVLALQNVLARSQVLIPDLETPYSQVTPPNTNCIAIELKDQTAISTIIVERHQQLDAILHDISGLDTVMDGIKDIRQRLVKQKDKIVQSMTLHKRLASALWRLPPEILSHIFMYCLPEEQYLSPASSLAPMLLTRICRRWTDVAMCTPGLWCKLFMDVDYSDWQLTAFGCNSWLKRSRQYPLSLAVKCVAKDITYQRILLQPYLNQISSLFAYFPLYCTDTPFMLTELVALRELVIHNLDHKPALVQWISRLPPSLRSLKMTGLSFNFEQLFSSNPTWFHLTNVHARILKEGEVLLLLHLCPNLSSLTARIRPERPGRQTFMPYTHTKLQSFRITAPRTPDHSVSRLMKALLLPDLRVLEAINVTPWPHNEFKGFMARSRCPLETLIFGAGVTIKNDQRAEYIALIPSLEVVVDPELPNCHDLLILQYIKYSSYHLV